MHRKVLFCATVDTHILLFHLRVLEWFQKNGYEVHVATQDSGMIPFCDKKHQLAIERLPFKAGNIKAIKQLKNIIEEERFDIVHCHTPMGGLVTRLAAKNARKSGTKVLYTAHGFHFYKGAPIINWLIYYPIEKYLSRYTDCLITINKEDYNRAVNNKFKANRIEHIQGVGVSLERFKPINSEDKKKLKKEYGYSEDDYIIMYVAELIKRKNQEMLIKAMGTVRQNIPRVKLLLVGTGELGEYYKQLVEEYKLTKSISFLGYRKDVEKLLGICDLYVSTSKQEGLPVNIMEAMACNVPVCATKVRGHVDLIQDQISGYLVERKNQNLLTQTIMKIYEKQISNSLDIQTRQTITDKYSAASVEQTINKLYLDYMHRS